MRDGGLYRGCDEAETDRCIRSGLKTHHIACSRVGCREVHLIAFWNRRGSVLRMRWKDGLLRCAKEK